MKRAATIVAILALLLSACAVLARAPNQPRTGALDGKLTDWHSLPLGEASVVLRNLSTGATQRTVTQANGSYRFTNLDPGEYRLEAEMPQLGKGAVQDILISAGHLTRVQAALILERPAPRLAVESGIHDLDPVTPAVATMIPSEELNALPVANRSWEQFAAITPAGNPVSQGGSENGGQLGESEAGGEIGADSVSIASASPYQTAASIDGIQRTPQFRAGNSFRGPTESLGESAVEAMQARTGNAPAGEGRSPGGAIELTTAHGRNGLHGQAFYLNRQNFFGAQNPFTQLILQTAPASGIDTATFAGQQYTPPETRQTFGVGIGREIKRDKLYWFAALDGVFLNDPAVATVRHPSDFFAQLTVPQLTMLDARLDLAGPDLLEAAATTYSGWLNQLDGLLGAVPRTSAQLQGFGRVDWQATERQHVIAEFNAASENAPSGALTRTSETYASHSFGNSQSGEVFGLGKLDSFVTANLLNTAAAEFRRQVQRNTPQSPIGFEASLLENSFDSYGQLPEIVADSTNGLILGTPARRGKGVYPDERAFLAQDTVSWVRGAHLVKAGASFDHIFDAVGVLGNQFGTYSYADIFNFVSDTASYLQYGLNGVDNPYGTLHNCDATGRVYNAGPGNLGGLGDLPCYAWYSQSIGPPNWHLSSNDLAAFATEQWQPLPNLTLSAGLRAEAEQLPPAIPGLVNAAIPGTQKLPAAQIHWGPRFGLAFSPFKSTVLRLGAGLYFGRVDNSVALAALTQTGSPNGDLNYFFRPTDLGAPPFPSVFPVQPQTPVTPGAVFFAPNFRNQQIDQAVFSVEQQLPSHWLVSLSALASLGRHLPISVDTNIAPAGSNGAPQTITYAVVDALQAGPIKSPEITVPFYSSRLPCMPQPACITYQQLDSIESRANSTYDAAMFKVVRYGGRGLTLRAHYLYAHATDWNPNESGNVAVNDILDPADFRLEYGTSNLDIRHSAAASLLYRTPQVFAGRGLRDWAGLLANGWSLAAIGQYRSGLPYTMRTGGYIPGFYNDAGDLIQGIAPGINGSGGDNRVYGMGSDGIAYNIGRNTYRYPATWTADARLAKGFRLPQNRELEVLAESFNLFNHENVTQLETTGYTVRRGTTAGDLPTLNFLTGLTSTGAVSTIPEFGKPLDINATNYYHPRQFQLGVRARF